MSQFKRPLEASWVSQVTLGSNNPVQTAAYLAAFGHTSFAAPEIGEEAAETLYGNTNPLKQVLVRPSDLPGEIRIIETDKAAYAMKPFQSGLHGVDYYTSNLSHSKEIAVAAGGNASQPVVYAAGKASILESRVLSKDEDFAVFISEVAERPFPSALDQQPHRQFSDLVTVVAFVNEKDVPAEIDFWTETAGLELFRKDLEFDDNDMQALMDLPSKARMGAVQFCDSQKRRRLELLFYKGVDCPLPPGPGLFPGFHSIAFPVKNLDAAIKGFPNVSFTERATIDVGKGLTSVAAATSPGGIRFELYEAVS